MFQVRIHGRGGQGVVTAAEMLSIAAFEDGKHAQAFPTFGSERAGAPVTSFCRIDEWPIRVSRAGLGARRPDHPGPDAASPGQGLRGLQEDGYVLINTSRSPRISGSASSPPASRPGRLLAVPASEIASRRLGRPLPNTALLGGFAAMTGVVTLEAVVQAIGQKFSGDVADRNMLAATEAHDFVQREIRELARA